MTTLLLLLIALALVLVLVFWVIKLRLELDDCQDLLQEAIDFGYQMTYQIDAMDHTARQTFTSLLEQQSIFDEVMRRCDGIRDLHKPTDEETERFHDDGSDLGDLDGPCPTPETLPLGLTVCPGHPETIQVCTECGYEHDGDHPTFRVWPCPTVALLDGEPECADAG